MTHILFPSTDALLDATTLSEVTGQRIADVRTHPLHAEYAKSGSHLLVVETNAGQGPRFILKRVSAAWDWLMRATDDERCRSVTLWTSGVFDRMPPEIEHATVACARDGDGWAILMRDVEPDLMPYARLSEAQADRVLDALAALHATFFAQPNLADPPLGLCTPRHVYGMFSPATGHREAGGAEEVPQRILEGWDLFPRVVAPDVADVVLSLVADPAPLCAALARWPQTLIHGDARHANLGLWRDGRRVVMLDWALAAVAPPAVELGRFLGTNTTLLPTSKEATLAGYRAHLARWLGDRFSDDWWEPQLALGLLGGFVQDGWSMVLKASHWRVPAEERPHWRADLEWWSNRVREGVKWV